MTRAVGFGIAVAIVASAGIARAAPIIGGTMDTGDPSVVMLAAYPADHSTLFTCTAVVIAPRHLLTAAHCVDHPASYTYGVFYGADGDGTLAQLLPNLAAVTAVHIDPDYSRSAPYYGDIAIVDLAADAPAAPLAFARTAPTSADVGAAVTIVGYGQTVAGTANAMKFSATTSIAGLGSDDTVLVGDSTRHTCVGDSGGPAILSGTVIGVDSYTDTTGCTGPSHFRRTDAFLPFIDAAIAPPAGADAGTGGGGGGGGCSSSGGGGGLALVALAALPLRRRR